MINSKSTKATILAAYNENQSQLAAANTQLRIALIWAISATALFLAF